MMGSVVSPSTVMVKLPPLASHSMVCTSSTKTPTVPEPVVYTICSSDTAGAEVAMDWISGRLGDVRRTDWTSSTMGADAHSTWYRSTTSPPFWMGSPTDSSMVEPSRTVSVASVGSVGTCGSGTMNGGATMTAGPKPTALVAATRAVYTTPCRMSEMTCSRESRLVMVVEPRLKPPVPELKGGDTPTTGSRTSEYGSEPVSASVSTSSAGKSPSSVWKVMLQVWPPFSSVSERCTSTWPMVDSDSSEVFRSSDSTLYGR